MTYEPAFNAIIRQAFETLSARLQGGGPALARETMAWMDSLARGALPEEPYKHPLSYPMLLFPWWAERALRPADDPDPEFQAALVYSTACGYYAIRMIDNLMDGHATTELQLLPAMHFFEAEFTLTYLRYFEPGSPFWDFFAETWHTTAEVTLRDARAAAIDRTHFEQVTAQKTCAVKIPLAAVCYRYGTPASFALWSRVVDRFGCWHQMYNDLFDWRKDLELRTHTFFLDEGERRRGDGETVAAWVYREGMAWGVALLNEWMAELRQSGEELGSPGLLAYLAMRQALLEEKRAEIQRGIESAAQLLSLLQQAKPAAGASE